MSRFLHIDCEPLAQPAATDLLEKATWSSLRIRIGARTVSRVLDKKINDERSLLYLPVFAIAEWIANNWWPLVNESCRTEFVPQSDSDEPHFSWIKRHCLRAAESDLLLPSLYIYSDGRGIRTEWRADDDESLPHMPAFFVDSGWAALGREATEHAMGRFVADTLSRVAPSRDQRVCDLRDTWNAIQSADHHERAFCTMAGRLGLDPYDRDETTDPIARVIEELRDADEPIVNDLTSAVTPANLEEHWSWVQQVKDKYHVGAGEPVLAAPRDSDYLTPAKYGYSVAQELRERVSLPADVALTSVEDFAKRILGAPLHVIDENHLISREIKLVAGRDGSGASVLIGPRNSIDENERFRLARGLFQVAVANKAGPRLVTDAYTWNQRASRAFAAELIAPQRGLKARAGLWADPQTIRELGREFGASTILIERQLKNAHVPITDD